MPKNIKYYFLLVAFGVGLYATLMNFNAVWGFVSLVFGLLLPVIAGFLAAFILNVPMSGFENLFNKIFKKAKKKPSHDALSVISLILTLISVFLILSIVVTMLIPEIISSARLIYEIVQREWPRVASVLTSYNIDVSTVTEFVEGMNFENLIKNVSNIAGTLLSQIINIASSAASGVSSFIISAVITVYVLLEKRELARRCKKLLLAYCKQYVADYICHVGKLITTVNSKFISGQCVEACILGVLIFIAFAIVKIPYASLIGVLAAVSAFIPYVGAFVACAIGAFLVLLSDPTKVILCIVLYLVVQFVENQFIYPRVVGSSVGLSPLLTLVAVFVGGNLFGLFGMIFFIPLTAVLVTLVKENAEKSLAKKFPPQENEIPPADSETAQGDDDSIVSKE